MAYHTCTHTCALLVGEIPDLVRYVDHRHHRLGGWIGLAEGAAEDVLKGLQALSRDLVLPCMGIIHGHMTIYGYNS